MATSVLYVSMLVLGFYYGALFLSMSPRIYERLNKWISSGDSGKGKSIRQGRVKIISDVTSIQIKKVFLAHWVMPGPFGNQSSAIA